MSNNIPKSFKAVPADKERNINGGATYPCRHCGFKSSNYWSVYANALKCVTKKYGKAVLKTSIKLFG